MLFFPHVLAGEVNWQALTVPAAGFVVALAVLGAGFFLVSRRKVKPPELNAVIAPDPFIQGGTSERRQSPRRAGQSIKVSIQLVNDQHTEFEGYVMDRSMG